MSPFPGFIVIQNLWADRRADVFMRHLAFISANVKYLSLTTNLLKSDGVQLRGFISSKIDNSCNLIGLLAPFLKMSV